MLRLRLPGRELFGECRQLERLRVHAPSVFPNLHRHLELDVFFVICVDLLESAQSRSTTNRNTPLAT